MTNKYTSFLRFIFLNYFLILGAAMIHAQSLEDYAKSMNDQSPSRWVQGKYRLLGASYINDNYTIKLEINAEPYFETEALNNHPLDSKILLGYYISDLYTKTPFRNLINTIIKNGKKFSFLLSTPSSNITSYFTFSSQEIKTILNTNGKLSSDQRFLKAHVVATNIGTPSYVFDEIYLDSCSLDSTCLTYHITFFYISLENSFLLEDYKDALKKYFTSWLQAFPECLKLVNACLNTNRNICFNIKNPRAHQSYMDITLGKYELQLLINQSN